VRNSYALTPTALAAIDAFHTQAFGIGLLATDGSMRRSRVQVGCVTHGPGVGLTNPRGGTQDHVAAILLTPVTTLEGNDRLPVLGTGDDGAEGHDDDLLQLMRAPVGAAGILNPNNSYPQHAEVRESV